MNQYKVPRRGKGNSKNTGSISVGKIILLTVLSLVFAFFLIVYLFLNIYTPAPDIAPPPVNPPIIPDPSGVTQNQVDMTTAEEANPGDPFVQVKGERYTFLIAGYSGGPTDTIMLVMFNVKDGKLSILSIPRDTYVNMPSLNVPPSSDTTDKTVTVGSWSEKINAAWSAGYNAGLRVTKNQETATKIGMRYFGEVIRYTLGIPVNRYIFIDTRGFKKLVDQIGGIDFDVPMNMDYEDPEQGLYIHLKKGFQHLDGNQAEQLVRFREGYLNQDIGRIETQQKFMAALIKKLLNFNLTNISSLFDFSSNYVTTDISVGEAGWFAAKLLNVPLSNMRVNTLPTLWLNAPFNWSELYKQETMEIINKYYNPYKQDLPEDRFNIYDNNIGSYDHNSINIDGTTLDTLVQ